MTVTRLAVGVFALALPSSAPAQLEVTYLANEGFLIRGGGKCVAIDCLFGDGIPGYPRVPAKLRKKLEAGTTPFDRVDLILATHVHPDHFNAKVVARYLKAHTNTTFLSTPQAAKQLRRVLRDDKDTLARVKSALPDEGKRETVEVSGIRVDVMQLTHGRMRRPAIQNVGFVVTLGGKKFLHIGDSEAVGSDVRRFTLQKDGIDVAFLPCWYLSYDKWKTLVTSAIAPKQIVVMHLPSKDAPKGYFGAHKSYARLIEIIRGNFPDAVLFRSAGETRTLAATPTSRPAATGAKGKKKKG